MDTLDIAVRLGAATLVGVLLGLNRDLHGKSTAARQLPDQSTTTRVESSSTDDPRLRGALP
jgi:hypothetical protein